VKSHLESVKSEVMQLGFYAILGVTGTALSVSGKLTIGELLATMASYASIQPLTGEVQRISGPNLF